MTDWHSEHLKRMKQSTKKARTGSSVSAKSLGESIGEARAVAIKHQLKEYSRQRTQLDPLLGSKKTK